MRELLGGEETEGEGNDMRSGRGENSTSTLTAEYMGSTGTASTERKKGEGKEGEGILQYNKCCKMQNIISFYRSENGPSTR